MRPAIVLPLLLAACACGPSSSAPRPSLPSARAAAAPVTLPDGSPVPIPNFAQVDDGLYRGGQPDEAGFAALRALGVKTIVNLRSAHTDAPEATVEGLNVVPIPLYAFVGSDEPEDEELRRFFDVVLDPERRPVYVHCAYGKDRTGTMCAVYRMEVDGWTPAQALAEMRSRGFHEMYDELEDFVRDYVPRGFAKTPR